MPKGKVIDGNLVPNQNDVLEVVALPRVSTILALATIYDFQGPSPTFLGSMCVPWKRFCQAIDKSILVLVWGTGLAGPQFDPEWA